MPLHPYLWARQNLLRLAERLRDAPEDGLVGEGYHNMVRVKEIRQPFALLWGKWSGSYLIVRRTPKKDVIETIPRIWRDHESEVLQAVNSRLPYVPRCLEDGAGGRLSAFVRGRLLGRRVMAGGTYGSDRMTELATIFATLADVPKDSLPNLPDDWPVDTDTQGFLRWLVRFTEGVYWFNLSRFGRLFDGVGVPEDSVERFLATVPELTRRPFVLLHADAHADNFVVAPGKDGDRLVPIDWETAMYGDALYDLAVHLVRMRYGEQERTAMIGHWADAMRHRHPEVTDGLETDLPVYLDFERVQSVFTDVMRAATGLPERPGERDFSAAADRVLDAVRLAREVLGIEDPAPQRQAVESALREWHERERRMSSYVCGHEEGARGWGDSRGNGRGRPAGALVTGVLSGAIVGSLAWAVMS
ncbi:aminoglycoside phosphotransferase family protein [Streptomyces sp. 351MFTsu5.1]|uniref:aminoglycoside phosphotransferase family protein n=1 Tax=Streptomyces sp. 351MFTsu5.1 TaxID=1172180 RepID=UPI000369900D|nr:aminoglycoside phosphotransferase family protein [Streptomyces sp. 351MFTsu5.1]